MVTWKSLILSACALVLGVWAGWEARLRMHPDRLTEVRDTIVKVEERTIIKPVPRESLIVRWKVVSTTDTLRDTLTQVVQVGDSVRIPIQQRVYGDSTYTAYVSGYEPCLDSICLRLPTTEVRVKTPAKRWNFGLQGGVGITPKGVQPYIGFGVAWRLGK